MMSRESALSKPSSKIFSARVLPWLMCGLGALFYCYEYLLRISPSVMTNDLMGSFSINAGVLGNLIAYYYYIYTPMQLPVGVLMDRFGPRRLLSLACIICVLGTFWFAKASHAESIGFARLLTGLGSAFAFVGVLKLISLWLPENRFALASGLALTLGTVGAMVGDNVMAALSSHHGWRHTEMDFGYIGLVLAAVLLIFMRDKPRPAVVHEHNPMTQTTFKKLWPEVWTLVKNPLIWIIGIIGCLTYLPASAFAELWGVPFIKAAYGMHREGAAEAVCYVFLGLAIGSPIVGWISDTLRQRRLPMLVGSIGAGIVATMIIYAPHLSPNMLHALLFFFGVFSSVQVLVFAIGREVSPENLSGTAVAFTNMLVMLGGVIFQPLIGILLDDKWDGLKAKGVPIYTLADYHFAMFSIPAGFLLAVLLLYFVMPETHVENTKNKAPAFIKSVSALAD